MRKQNFMKVIFALFAVALLATACSSSAESKVADQVNGQQDQYNSTEPLHFYTDSYERYLVQKLYDFRIMKMTNTWSVAVGDGTGEPIDMCESRGFGIPYNTSMTNSQQVATYDGGGHLDVTIDQAEPNGLYPGGSTAATWVMCIARFDDSGTLHPWYVESNVLVYDDEVIIAFDPQRGMYRIQHTGAVSNNSAAITIDPNVNPQFMDPNKFPTINK